MVLELLSKKVSCKYKHNSLKEMLRCLLTLFHLPPPNAHPPNTHIPCHSYQMISWVFHVQNQRDPYTRGHFSSVHWKGEKRHFCRQNVRVPSIGQSIKTGFLSQRLNFRWCPPKPLPSSTQHPLEKKKKIKTTCHHPPHGINSYLPKKGRKERRDTEGQK